MNITASMVKELRDKTSAGMMDCKKALENAGGDLEKAAEILREKGLSDVEKKSSRIASEGVVEAYIHGGRIGSIVEINSETDFVAKNDEFKQFAKDIAMHIVASAPLYVSREDVPEEEVEKEKEFLTHQAINENKEKNMPEDKAEMIAKKMVEGRMDKFFERVCLLDQAFVKNPDQTVGELLTDLVAKIGENIQIRRFVRYEVGEGLEKREEDFAEEVAKQMK
ncbi:MAG: translation elongation factor Ts [Tissierellia bacterium]|nr:translation elongation factor Ts [Tissierellia bacterium]